MPNFLYEAVRLWSRRKIVHCPSSVCSAQPRLAKPLPRSLWLNGRTSRSSVSIQRRCIAGWILARPSRTRTCARAPHHLIDVVEPEHAYSAARFGTEALKSIQDIHARGARPLLVGGAMLYYKALIEGLNPLPPANAAVRAALAQDAARAGWPALHARLTACDPALAARI